MRNPMCPVTAEIKNQVTRNEGPPGKRKAPGNPIVQENYEIKDGKFKKKIDDYITHSYSD
jgi:hypothetical protein